MRKISKIIVHCTDSPDDLDIGFKEINSWHKDNGWLSPSGVSCGYHYIVRRDGRVQKGRLDSENGAHAAGHNSNSIGVVWVGRKEIALDQLHSLLVLINGLRQEYGIPIDKVYGHTEVDSRKTCPNQNMDRLRFELLFTKLDAEDNLAKWREIRRQSCLG